MNTALNALIAFTTCLVKDVSDLINRYFNDTIKLVIIGHPKQSLRYNCEII